MKKIFVSFILLIVSILAQAAIGDWKIYMSYNEPQQIEATGNCLFVRASNSIYLYNKNDQSIQTFDKTTGMSDVVVTHIAWNQQAKRLVVVYDNSNIDLIDLQGNIVNMADLYNKSMTADKTVNSIYNTGEYAYLATNFGGVKLNVAKQSRTCSTSAHEPYAKAPPTYISTPQTATYINVRRHQTRSTSQTGN